MTVRGGGVPISGMASKPLHRKGPPLRSFAADAHDCIMVRSLKDLPNTRLWRDDSRPKAGSPLIVIPTASSVPPCSELSRYGLASAERLERLVRRPTLTAPARAGFAILRVEETGFQSNKETRSRKQKRKITALKPLDNKSPIQRFAQSQIPLAPRAPSIHDPELTPSVHRSTSERAVPESSTHNP